LIQLEYSGFDGATVPICTFTIENTKKPEFKGSYIRLSDFRGSENQAPKTLEAIKNPDWGWFYRVSADDFQKIPGSPIGYWVSNTFASSFLTPKNFEDIFTIKAGISTGDNNKFILLWPEVNFSEIKFVQDSPFRYVPHNKGGEFRKWAGNYDYLLKYSHKAILEMQSNAGFRHDGKESYFFEHIGWSKITSAKSSFRFYPESFSFDSAGLALFGAHIDLLEALAFLNSKIAEHLIQVLNPTLNVTPKIIKVLPWKRTQMSEVTIPKLLRLSLSDWDSYETSWDFKSLLLLNTTYRGDTLASTYSNLRAHWNAMTLEIKRLEEENNRIFIEAYGLEDELTPDVPLKEITLTCNPYYRYGDNKSDSELEELLLADTMKELISYAVGCMFGRYSLDKPGLILANQGETYSDYCRLVPNSSFPADEDNAIPVLDGDWFSDDIVSRFRKFLRVAFGEDKYEENLRFVEAALGKDLRQYFLRDFYNDHVKRYKKRPIYWMFSSPDGSFNVLIYMHRYRPDTASIILSEYLREYQVRLSAYMDNLRRKEANPDLSKGEKVKALKELDKLRKTQDALTAYERDVLFPLANQRIEIDLDDGVKVNYPKFGVALKKIAGLEAKDEE